LAHSDAGEGEVRPGNALGKRDDVGDNAVEVLKAEHLAGAAEAEHDFVEDEEDVVLVAQRADTLEVARRRDEHAAASGDRLEEDGGNSLGAFVHDLLFHRGEATVDDARLVVPPRERKGVGVKHVHKAADVRLRHPAPGVSRHRERRRRAAVVRAVAREDLLPPCEAARGAHRRLVRFASAGREQKAVDVARADLRQQLR
jgi:hypothetical protein